MTELTHTPLATAVRANDAAEVERLLNDGADVTEVAGVSDTRVLHWATDPAIAKALIEAGADVDARDDEGKSVLYYRAASPEALEVIDVLLAAGARPTQGCLRGVTPLHRAAGANAVAIARRLMESGAIVDALTNERNMFPGQSPLHHAAKAGHVEMVRLLLDAGADGDRQDRGREGYTREGGCAPIHLATEKGHLPVIELLLERDADPFVMNGEDRTPADVAEWYDHDACEQRLREAMSEPI